MAYLEQLYELFRASMPGDTVLVMNSRAAGRRVLAAVAERCGALVGVRAETPLSLALDLCAGPMSADGAPRLMDEDEAADLTAACMRASAGMFDAKLAVFPDAVREVSRTLRELDMEEVGALPADGGKLEALQTLRKSYAAAKEAGNLCDRADLFPAATKQAQAGNSTYVTLPSVRFTAMERALLEKLSGGRLAVVPMDVPKDISPPRGAIGGGRPADPFANLAGRVRTVACIDANMEAHQVFRDILKKGWRFDACAVAYAEEDGAARLREAAGRYGISISMTAGVSAEQTGLLAALRILSELKSESFDAERFCTMLTDCRCLRDGYPYRLAKALRSYHVGWGDRTHYLDFVERYRETEWDRKKPEEQTEEAQAELNALCDGWKTWLEQAFTIAEPDGATPDEQKAALRGFLNGFDRTDALERSAFMTALDALENIGAPADGERVIDRLLARLERGSVMCENACPGKVLCLPLGQALTACREHLYIVGLGRDAFAPDTESAVLLDDERRALVERGNVSLQLSCESGEEKQYLLEELLLHHEGDLALSYAALDNDKQVELLPARILEQIEHAAGIMRETVSYIPAAPLDAGDVLLREAATELLSTTAYPGDANGDPTVLETEKVFSQVISEQTFSASSMEEALRCPLSFYLSHLLRAERDNPPKWKMNEWLPANVMGTFCHKVLERYYAEGAQKLDEDAGAELLERIFDEEWETVRKENPPASKRLMDADRERAEDMICGAIGWTKAEGRVVEKTERNFGLSDSKDAAVELTAGSETFSLRGSIDRVDRLPDGSYGIVDYKTGDPGWLEREKDYHLQHYLYKEAEKALSDGAVDARDAGYLLLAEKAQYLPADEDSDKNAARLVEALLKGLKADEANALKALPHRIKDGNLIPWDSEEEQKEAAGCKNYCRYRELCPLCDEGGENV